MTGVTQGMAEPAACGRCGHEPACGYASVTKGDEVVWLCHADDHSCYDRLGTALGALGRLDRCVTLHCNTPTNPSDWPTVCASCRADVDAALDDHWSETDPEMSSLHRDLLAEEAGYKSTSGRDIAPSDASQSGSRGES